MTIFARGTPLSSIGVTQNELGWYYWSGSSYYKPLLKDFDTATPPAGYKKYTDGSHKSYLSQRAIDFSVAGNIPITFDEPVAVTYSSSAQGSYCRVQTSEGNIFLVHTDRWATGNVRVGEPVCYIKAMSGAHLHIYLEGGRVRDIILGKKKMEQGDFIEWTKDTNIRQGHGTSYPINATAKQGAVAYIRSSEVRRADGYEWMDVGHPNVTGWAVVQNMRLTDKSPTNVDGSPIVPPTPPKTCEERIQEAVDSVTQAYQNKLLEAQEAHSKCEVALGEAHAQTEAARAQLARTEQDLKLCQERNEKLEADIKEMNKLAVESAKRIESLEVRNGKLEQENAKLRADLKECQGSTNSGCLSTLASLVNKLLDRLNGNKLSLGLQERGTSGAKGGENDKPRA